MGNFRDNRGGGRSFGPRRDFGGGRFGGRHEMHKATCASCGKECEVPFRPSGERPVYCSDCFEKQGGNERKQSFGGNRDRGPRPFRGPDHDHGHPPQPHKQEFDAINAKLDKILAVLNQEKVSNGKTEVSHSASSGQAVSNGKPAPKKKRAKKAVEPEAAQTQPEVTTEPEAVSQPQSESPESTS